MEVKNNIFMAFAKGSVSKEGVTPKLYVGVGGVFIRAINPTKEEMAKLYDREIENDPVYVTEKEGVKSTRLTFICQFDPSINKGCESFVNITFFLRNEARVGANSGKTQIIDKYGRTAWADEDVLAAKEIPQYSNGPAKIDANYRPAYSGEENLIGFLKQYLGVENINIYKNGEFITNPAPENCEAGLEKIANYFNGDFSELKEIIALQPMNKVKAYFGVRIDDKGNEYQDTFLNKFLKNNATNYNSLIDVIKENRNNGGYANTEFNLDAPDHNLKLWEVTASVIEPSATPFPPQDNSNPWG